MSRSNDLNAGDHGATNHEATRRDFLFIATGAMAAVGTAGLAWPFVDSMNPSADALSFATTEIDISSIGIGERVTVMWRGKPVFVDRRTSETIANMQAVSVSALRDPETDEARTHQEEWLVVVGVCTHLGCVPLGQNGGDNRGEWGGLVLPMPWFPLRSVWADHEGSGTEKSCSAPLSVQL